MQRIIAPILLSVALTAPLAAVAQDETGAGPSASVAAFDTLAEKDKRRLEFYAGKIVDEIAAVKAASETGDIAAFNRHGKVMKTSAERFLDTARKTGLTETQADLIFRQHLSEGLEGPLPFFLAGASEQGALRTLSSVQIGSADDTDADYVGTIREAGQTLFGQ